MSDKTPICPRDGKPCAPSDIFHCSVDPCRPRPVAPDSLVARLRLRADDREPFSGSYLMEEAADRIEQLQREWDDSQDCNQDMIVTQRQYEASLAAAEIRLARITQALTELVSVKDLKDRAKALEPGLGRPFDSQAMADEWDELMDEYHARQPLAWQAARDAIRHTTEG